MSDFQVVTPDLHAVAKQFRDWRSRNGRKAYPHDLWNAAIQHAHKLSVTKVARAIGVTRYYLQVKIQLAQRQQPSQFVEVLLPLEKELPQPSPVELRISHGNGLEMAMKFDGSIQEIMPVVERLFCGGELT